MGKESAFGALLFCPIGGPVEAAAGYNLRGGFPPGPGRGSRLSLEKARTQRVAGGGPPPPLFLWPARSHSLVLGLGDALFRLCAYFEPHVRALIWGLSFAKFFFSIFFPENASQIGLRISEEIAPLPYQRQRSPKRASGSKRAMKTRGPGACPWCSFLRLSSKESRAPRRSRRGTHVAGSTLQRFQRSHLPMIEGRRGNGALRPKVASEPPT